MSERYDVTQQVGHLLRRAYQRHLAIFADHAAGCDVTSIQFVVLCCLRDLGPCSQAELIRASAVDQATIRGILERLRSRGLLRQDRDAADGRKLVLSVTPEAEALLDGMYPVGRGITEATLAGLSPAERVALQHILGKIVG